MIGRTPRERGHPGYKTALELFGIECSQDVAEVIMSRRAVREGAEAAQESELLLTKPGHVGDRLGTGQHGEQAQQQDLIEGVEHLGLLARVRQVFEKPQKNNRFSKRTTVLARAFHDRVLNEPEDIDRFSTSPQCHAHTHPIALTRDPSARGVRATHPLDRSVTAIENAITW